MEGGDGEEGAGDLLGTLILRSKVNATLVCCYSASSRFFALAGAAGAAAACVQGEKYLWFSSRCR